MSTAIANVGMALSSLLDGLRFYKSPQLAPLGIDPATTPANSFSSDQEQPTATLWPRGSYARRPSATQSPLEQHSELSSLISEVLQDMLDPPTSFEASASAASMRSVMQSQLQAQGGRNHCRNPALQTRCRQVGTCCMFLLGTLLSLFLVPDFRISAIAPFFECTPIPVITSSSADSLTHLLSLVDLNARRQYNFSQALFDNSDEIWNHLTPLMPTLRDNLCAEFPSHFNCDTSSDVSPDLLHEAGNQFLSLNFAFFKASLDVLSSSRATDRAIAVIRTLTTSTASTLSDIHPEESAKRWPIYTQWARDVERVVDIEAQRLAQRDWERSLMEILRLATDTGFRTSPRHLCDAPSYFESRLKQKLRHGWPEFRKGDPTWDRLAECENAIVAAKEKRLIWRGLKTATKAIASHVDGGGFLWWLRTRWCNQRAGAEMSLEEWHNLTSTLEGIVVEPFQIRHQDYSHIWAMVTWLPSSPWEVRITPAVPPQ